MAKPEYDVQGLLDSIDHSKKTIKTLEDAISNEQTQIANYRKMIETLEQKQAISEGIVLDASQ